MDHIASLQSALQKAGMQAMLVTSVPNRRYITGFPSSAGMALVTPDAAWFFTDSRYIEAAERQIPGAAVMETNAKFPYEARLREVLTARGLTEVGFEQERMSYSQYEELQKKLPVRLVPAQQLPEALRASKTPEEVQIMKRAQAVAEKAFLDLLDDLTPAMTEREAAYELTYRMMRFGAEDCSFRPIFVSGTASSMPHGVPRDVKLQKGFLTMDFGAKVDGYCSDTTRTVCLGTPTEEMRKVYATVLEAQKAGIRAARAEISGKALDGAAREVIEKAGYGAYFGHGFGHGLGLEVHETPRASLSYDGIIPAGAVISAEPGIYLPGKFGVRIEDVLYITADGSENLTTLPKDLMIL